MTEQTNIEDSGDDRAILSAAADIDGAAEQLLTGASPQQAGQVEVIDPAAAWAEIPATIGGILSMALPEAKQIYTPQACRAWGDAMNRLASKRGWSAEGLPPEVGVGLTSAMFIIPTVVAIKARRAQADAARRAQQQHEQGAAAGVLPENPGGLDGAQAA